MPLQIVSLQDKHLEDAAGLVCSRYKTFRRQLPVLPPRYERSENILPMLQELARESPGVAALRGSRLVGFMQALVISEFMGRRSAYSPVTANAAEPQDCRRIYEEMYAHLSPQWLSDGCFTHLVSLLAGDPRSLEAWHWLGFGLINVDAIRDLTPVVGEAAGAEVRQAGLPDARIVSELGHLLERHVASTPTYWIHDLEDFGERLSEPGNAAWLAFEGEEAIGFMALEPGVSCDCELFQDEKTANINGAFTLETARGKGIATVLLNRALAWAQAQGHTRCAVDFETANFLATRFWMRRFNPVGYSLMRCLDSRLQPNQ